MNWPVIVAPFLKVDGMALFPFILLRQKSFKEDEVLIRHETIHLKQAIELLVIPFYLLYLANYLRNRVRYKDHEQAYINIVFEREAYHNEHNASYLKIRPIWAWRKYFGRQNN